MKKIVFIDMDGVLTIWEPDGKWWVKGYFRHLKPNEEAIRLVKLLQEQGYIVIILSAAPNVQARIDKSLWLKEHGLGDVMCIFVPYGTNKADAVKAFSHGIFVLVDDNSSNLWDWTSAGHIGVKFRNGINGTKGTWKGFSISYTQTAEEMYADLVELFKNLEKPRFVSLMDGTGMGGELCVFHTNAPVSMLKELETISCQLSMDGRREEVPIWADYLVKFGFLFEFQDSHTNVTAYRTSTDWLENKYPHISEHYVIEG